jgi:hypothetical protein
MRKKNLIQNITEKLQQKLRQNFQESTKDIEKLMDENDRLKKSLENGELTALQQQLVKSSVKSGEVVHS